MWRWKNEILLLGFITALIIGGWITLAITGVISVMAAILVPVGIVIGLGLAIFIFSLLWRHN